MLVMFECTCGNWTLTCCGRHRGVLIFGVSDQQKRCRERSMTGSRRTLMYAEQCNAANADKRSRRSVASKVAVVEC
jgi:hypothetical protein